MNLSFNFFQFAVYASCLFLSISAYAAEWKTEPSVFFNTQYNDNVRMRSKINNPEGSSGFTLEPRVKFKGEELKLWDMAVDARGKITRYQSIEDGDSENVFFIFNGGRQTERSNWRLKASYEQNTNFDTSFDTESPDAGILSDRTDRTTSTIEPSVSWSPSETSQIQLSLNATDVSYDEVIRLTYKDYTYDTVQFLANWLVAENHKTGFTSSYAEYDSPDTNFSYNQVVLQADYTYTINELSNFSLSLGGRRLESLRENQFIGCVDPGDFLAFGCPISGPAFADLGSKDDGTITNVSYARESETASHSLRAGRSVIPSSFGGVQDKRNITYQFKFKNTERLTTELILDAYKTDTIRGNPFYDRSRYRVEPTVVYKLSRNWNLKFIYRYINQSYTNRINADSESNAVFINLFLHWPKLVSSY